MPLIVCEGIDGCGKTTQVERLTARLSKNNIAHRVLREPGGTELGERQRAILLDPRTNACPVAELFGYLQARAQLCHDVVAPALLRGEVIILDRFWYSTIAYQCFGLGVDEGHVRAAITLAVGDVKPDLALWFAVNPDEAARRRAAARGLDRIEARGIEYLRRVHAGYEAMVKSDHLVQIDATQTIETVSEIVWQQVKAVIQP